jgi:FkbM family methyltransferase
MARLMIRQRVVPRRAAAGGFSETFLNYRMSFFDYTSFVELLDEIFIQRVYDFKTSSSAPLVVDCGGNIGLSVLYFKHYYPGARVLCFEPDQDAFAQLSNNVTVNKLAGVETHRRAVLDKRGSVTFYSDHDRGNRVGMSVTRRLEEKGMRVDETQVEAVCLSSYLEGPVDFLKLDVEGAELKVLRELAEKQKLSLIQQMVVECHYDLSNPENSFGELLCLLEDSGFRYVPHSQYRPPYHQHADRPYSFLLYAYRSHAENPRA